MPVFEISEGRWGYSFDGVYQEWEPGADGFQPMTEQTATYYYDKLINPTEAVQIPTISRAQAKLLLLSINKLDMVQQAIDSIQDPKLRQAVQIEWSDRPFFEINNTTLQMLASSIGINQIELAELFFVASTL